jgi:hypothetical protein
MVSRSWSTTSKSHSRYVFSVGHSEMHEVDVVVGPTWGLMPRYSRPQLAVTIDGIHSDSVRKVENGRA